MTQNFARHPLSECFGNMDDDEFQKFKDDIEAQGQHEPILIFEGMVLDGWHRYLATTQLGMDVKKFTFGGTFEEAQERVVSGNDKRKHRTVAQRAQAIVAVHACKPVGRPAKNNSAPGAELKEPPPAAKKIAEAHGIGTRSVERARVVQAAGLGPIVLDGGLTGKEAEAIATGKVDEPKKPAKPAKKAAAAKHAPWDKPAAPPAEDFGPSEQEIAAAQREQEEELASLRRIAESDDKLKAALAENAQLRAQIRVMQERINSLMNEKLAAVRAAKSWQRKAEAVAA